MNGPQSRTARSINRRSCGRWAVCVVCTASPFDASLIIEQHPPPHSFVQLRHAAEALGLEIERRPVGPQDLSEHDLPCIAWLQQSGADVSPDADTPTAAAPTEPADAASGNGGEDPAKAPGPDASSDAAEAAEIAPKLVLIARNHGGRLLYFHAGQDTPRYATPHESPSLFEAVAYPVRPEEEPAPADEAETTPRKFGFRWFVPELLRYKRVWRDILIASQLFQVLGLSMPLFTQVIIDKVISGLMLELQRYSCPYVVRSSAECGLRKSALQVWITAFLLLLKSRSNRPDAPLWKGLQSSHRGYGRKW